MSDYRRVARIAEVDPSAGTFPMTLATEGEASDGHILSVEGGRIPDRMPLLVSHWNDPHSQAGSVTSARKRLKESPPRITATGQIETSGEGSTAELRRDLLHMIGQGHIRAVSVRWHAEAKDAIPRTDLPKGHAYYVDRDKEPMGSPRRSGLYFKRWRALEGSIVSVGADPGALIGRAEATEGPISTFWRAMAEDAEEEGLAGRLRKLREAVLSAHEAGASLADCANAVSDLSEEGLEACEFRSVEIDGRQVFLPEALADLLERKRDARPDPSSFDSESEFVSACIPIVMHEGTAETPEQAAAICHSMWANRTAVVSDLARRVTEIQEELRREFLESLQSLERKLEAIGEGRGTNGDPSPPWTPKLLAETLQKTLLQARAGMRSDMEALIDRRRGRVASEAAPVAAPSDIGTELEALFLAARERAVRRNGRG